MDENTKVWIESWVKEFRAVLDEKQRLLLELTRNGIATPPPPGARKDETMWTRNPKEKYLGGEWWMYSTPLFVLHVFNRERGDGWQWWISGAQTIKSEKDVIFTKEGAINDCLNNVYLLIDEAKRGMYAPTGQEQEG